jgi:hypothetical protein
MKVRRMGPLRRVDWRKIALSLIDQWSKRVMAWFRKLSATSKGRGRTFSSYRGFAYPALASFRMGSGLLRMIQCAACDLSARKLDWHFFAAESISLNSGVPLSFVHAESFCKPV